MRILFYLGFYLCLCFIYVRFASRIVECLFHTVSSKVLCVLGFSFKSNTGDTRCSPAIDVCARLLEEGAKLQIYDPKVNILFYLCGSKVDDQ